MMDYKSKCCVCQKEASQLCGKCLNARYCSREHQKSHWKTHKYSCFPCRVEVDGVVGRHLVATRDIKAGDTIIVDSPLVVGPQYGTKPVCLGCNETLAGPHKCPRCSYFLCSSDCPNKINHRRECDLIADCQKRPNITTIDKANPIYHCITPLRCLWLKTGAPDKWEALMDMEAHLKEREGSKRYFEVKNFIVNTVISFFEMNQFTEDEIQTICGILETNGFEVPGMNLVALYPFAYLLEHSCIPNTTRTFDSRLRLVVKASVDIRAGDHISTSYVNPFWGQRVRRAHLMNFKYFHCSCPRCIDPTDLNTHLSSVKCKFCPDGLLVPPPEVTSDWHCNSCQGTCEADIIEKEIAQIYQQKPQQQTISSLEKFLKQTQKGLSDNHQFRLETKLSLLQMYGRNYKGKTEPVFAEDHVTRKKSLSKEVLEVSTLLCPGLSRIRGIVLFELQLAVAADFRRIHKKFRTTPAALALLQEAEAALKEALNILRLETHLEEEMEMVREGEMLLELYQKWKGGLKLVGKKSKKI